MTNASPANMLWWEPTELTTIDAARRSASFELRLPTNVPADLTVSRIRHHWPNWIPRDKPDPRFDFIEVRYTSERGADLEVIHGFFSRYLGAQAPEGKHGAFEVGEILGEWLTAEPSGTSEVDGRVAPARWKKGFAALAWQTGLDDTSPICISLASHTLGLDELKTLAAQVRPA